MTAARHLRSRALIGSAAVAAVVLVAVVVVLSWPASRSHHLVTAGSAGTGGASPAPATIRLGAGDSGRTISVTQGSTIDVNLDGGQAWPNQPSSSDTAVARRTGGSSTSTASRASFVASAAGTAKLSASGLPLCDVEPGAGQMCSQLAVEWTVTLTVN